MSVFGDKVYTISTGINNMIKNIISVYRSDLEFSLNLTCNPFQPTSTSNIKSDGSTGISTAEIIIEDPVLQNLDISSLNIVLYEKYILVFNVTQTPFPIFDKYVTDLFWPQTKYLENITICQPSTPVSVNTTLIWKMSESSLSFEITPFINCQGIPIVITTIQTSDLDSSSFIINKDKVLINSGYGHERLLRNLQLSSNSTIVVPDSTIKLIIKGETNTFVAMTIEDTFIVVVKNSPPIFNDYFNLTRVKISEGVNLSILYLSYCTSNSSMISVSDDEGDSVYLTVNIDGTYLTQNEINMNSQECKFNLFWNTSDYTPGNYSLNLALWDIFHKDSPSQIKINIELSYFYSPEFTSELTQNMVIQACMKTKYEFPQIVDQDKDFSKIELKSLRNELATIQNMTMIFYPTLNDLGVNSLTIELVDQEDNINDYKLTFTVVNEFKYNPEKINRIIVVYPSQIEFSVSNLLIQSISNKYSVQLKVKHSFIEWAKFIYETQSVIVSNYSLGDIGVHNLSISIYDSCFNISFESYATVEISSQHPPVAVGTFPNVTAYQGQEQIVIQFYNDIFYDKDNNFTIIMKCCDNVLVSSDISSHDIPNSKLSSYFSFKFNNNFYGLCPSKLIAFDSILQTATIIFYIDVLQCPQEHCLYCNGPDIKDCIKCKGEYEVSTLTGECIIVEEYFEKWVIMCFLVLVLLITIFTNHDLNASYILLESMTFYWMLFLIFKDRALIVITHFNPLLLKPMNEKISVNNNTMITSSFFINCVSILAIISIYSFVWIRNNGILTNSRILFMFRVSALSKYLQWASTYLWFCLFYEIINFDMLSDIKLFSYVFAITSLLACMLFSYCFIIYSSERCFLCNKFFLIDITRKCFVLVENIAYNDYKLIIRYNLIKKLLISFIIAFHVCKGLSPFIITFSIISIQTMYSNLAVGLFQFQSSVTRMLFIFNEVTMVIVVYLASIDYFNHSFNSIGNTINFINICLIMIRSHINLIILIELLRMALFMISVFKHKIIKLRRMLD